MKSGVSFFRRQLGKGKSRHSGRGTYDFSVEGMTNEQVIELVKAKLPSWQKKGLVKRVSTEDYFLVELADDVGFERNYKTLVISKHFMCISM